MPTNTIQDTGRVATPSSVAWKWLVPSLSDLFFLLIVAWMFLASPLGWERLLLDADTALHTRVGQYILSTHTVPRLDLFSFSKPGEAWYAFEWLSEVAFAAAFQIASFKGITFLAGMLIALYITVLLKYTLWKGSNGMIALVVILLAANATSIHFYARPHLFTLVLLAGSIWMIEDHCRHGGRRIWLLVPTTILWANLHAGFFVFFALLGLRLVGRLAEAACWPDIAAERKREAIQLAKVGVACGLASLLNPYGWRLHAHLLETLTSPWIMENVKEFLSPTFRSEELREFMLLLFAGLASLAPLLRKKDIVEPLWILFLAYLSLTSTRHTTQFALVAAPIIALELSEAWNAWAAPQPKQSIPGILYDVSRQLSASLPGTGAFIPAVIVVIALMPGLHWPTAFPDGGSIPAKLIESHADLLANGRVFASDQIADYLIFRNAPRQKVFIDSRHNYYGEQIGNEYLAISNGEPRWRSLLDQYRINLVLTEASFPLTSLLRVTEGWRESGQDSKYILFERVK